MVRPIAFLVLVATGIVAVAALLKPAPDRDVFTPLAAGQVVHLSGLGFSGVYAAKRAHGLAAPRHEVGLFGNSRSLMVGAADLGLTDAAFFNYSVIGGSFRASVLLMEQLVAAGRAPRLAIVSLDHLELQEDNNPAIAGIGPRLRLALDDAVAGATSPHIDWAEAARMAWRHYYGAVRDLGRILNFRRLMLGVRWHLGTLLGGSFRDDADDALEPGYRRDGSIALPAIEERIFEVSAPQPARYIRGYLEYDLERLAALGGRGVRVVIYESLLDPVNAAHVASHPNPAAEAARARWLAACRRLALDCRPFTHDVVPAIAGAWSDPSHPPPALLGRYVQGMIQRPVATD